MSALAKAEAVLHDLETLFSTTKNLPGSIAPAVLAGMMKRQQAVVQALRCDKKKELAAAITVIRTQMRPGTDLHKAVATIAAFIETETKP